MLISFHISYPTCFSKGRLKQQFIAVLSPWVGLERPYKEALVRWPHGKKVQPHGQIPFFQDATRCFFPNIGELYELMLVPKGKRSSFGTFSSKLVNWSMICEYLQVMHWPCIDLFKMLSLDETHFVAVALMVKWSRVNCPTWLFHIIPNIHCVNVYKRAR